MSDGLRPYRDIVHSNQATRRYTAVSGDTALDGAGCVNQCDIGRAVPAERRARTRFATIFLVMGSE